MIFITGDTHIPIDIKKLNTRNFRIQKELTKNDYVIICGDFGAVWDNSKQDLWWQKWLSKKTFTTLFIDGNHENFNLLNQYPVEIWNGGNVHKINESIIHLMRGQVYEIDGIKIFTMGGAQSHDKIYRVEGINWWKQELPTNDEFEEALNNLDKHCWKVDYVLTHCTSNAKAKELNTKDLRNNLTNFFDVIEERIVYKHWYFGHYHKDIEISEKFTAIYQKIVKL